MKINVFNFCYFNVFLNWFWCDVRIFGEHTYCYPKGIDESVSAQEE